jgi:hypothetical protein
MKTDLIDLAGGGLASKHRVVEVTVPAKVAVDLDLAGIHEIERDLFDKLGHPGCYSGFDIRWLVEERFALDAARTLQHR